MKKPSTFLLFIVLLLASPYVCAKTLYTWTDEDGVVHITETKPPADAINAEKNKYRTQPKRPSHATTDYRKNEPRRNPILEYDARNKAKRARRDADMAKKAMEDAINTANRMKAETDEYIEQWGVQARTRKSINAKINRKKEATNEAVAEAKRLTETFTQAETKAREAEKQLADLMNPPDQTVRGETENSSKEKNE